MQIERRAGSAPLTPPVEQDFWLAAVEGAGTRTLEWNITESSWMIVAMNADASPGVSVEAVAAARFGFVPPVATGLAVAGALLLADSFAAFIAAGRRSRTPRPPAADAAGSVPTPA